ncbi:CoA ester lyase [Actinotalea sp. K2]|uniref:HpcH/HpaI aldolase/citrate lyase family protein n=1 Tax=Actinotalea sp. K2 TaxID=2939438 RepID=UPI0020181590|nr:CoA ester lyase [Actinotalea sp. K2]MCL3862354.1 CoA ester lyase [Actinotalea sp. K2]
MTGFTMGPALLFCPADRPDRFGKAARRADAVILDLEDAVAPHDKAAAREALVASALDPDRTVVRVNQVGSPELAQDLAALATTGYRTVMLPKTGSAQHVDVVSGALPGVTVVALVETATGVAQAAQIAAAPAVVALMWGAEDLVASLGGTSSRHPDGRYRDVARHARASVLLAARAQSKGAVDAVHLDITDLEGLAAEVGDARASGFTATACIHPSHVQVIRAGYRPDQEEVDWARAVLDAADGQRGAFRWEGRMVDGPVLAHARQVLRRHG